MPLFEAAARCIETGEPEEKCRLTLDTAARWRKGALSLEPGEAPRPIGEPGRPARPALVHPRELPRRRLGSAEGRAALLHAVVHIEFNAINLAWDAVYRFRGMPAAFYADWLGVADDEARHFRLLERRLHALGYVYGDFPAHNGLWDMAVRTAHDPLARMAMVPRVMEARGLDVTPGMRERFLRMGDRATADALEVILREEVGHVAAGSRWFRYLCAVRGLEAEATYFELLDHYLRGEIRCPLQRETRRQAGFSETELNRLEALCRKSGNSVS